MSMQGRHCLITGATSGIGRATAQALAEAGATLFLLCRSREKGQALIDSLQRETGNTDLHLLVADLSVQADIRAAARELLRLDRPLHLLINNAGIVNAARRETSDGIEETFAVNHLAYFLLTELLRPRLLESAPARVVSVASMAHAFVRRVQLDDPEFKRGTYRPMRVYGHSKLCNILWNRELAAQLQGSGVTANCLHPGAVGTQLGTQNGATGRIVMAMLRPFFRTPEQGARTSIHLAVAPELDAISGSYYSNCKAVRPKPWAEDDAAARTLWTLSARMTGQQQAA